MRSWAKMWRAGLWLLVGLWATEAAAQTCPFRLQITRADGSRGCFTNLPIAQLVEPVYDKTLETLVSRAIKYQIAVSSQEGCVAAGFGAVLNLTASGIEDVARDQALSTCRRSGCQCQIVVQDGLVVSTLADRAPAAPTQAPLAVPVPVSPPPAARPSSAPATMAAVAPPVLSTPAARPAAEPSAKAATVASPLPTSEPTQAVSVPRQAAPPASPAPTTPVASIAAAPPPASPPPPIEPSVRRQAFVVGNDTYQSVPRLRNARADARAVAQMLGRLGFEVRLRLDLGERAFKDELRAFKAQLQGGEEAVFYFAGHGVQLRGVNYLLPVDIRGDSEDQVRDDAMPLQKVLDEMQDRRTRFALSIIDACRDNPFTGAGRATATQGLAPSTPATGQMVIFSAGAGQRALDSLGPRDQEVNGLFTRVLLREMDRSGVTIDRVMRNVRSEVATIARKIGHEQVPALYDQSLGDYILKR